MAKDTFYFSHDYNTRTDIKIKKLIQKHGYVGYGIFWAIVEDLYNNANALPADYVSIAYDLREDESLITSIINDFDLFIIDNDIISSESVERRLILRDAKTDKARAAALARWEKEREKKRLKDANALQTHNNSNAIKESKENESKENESIVNNETLQNDTFSELQNSCKNKIERYEETFLNEDLQNFIDLFKNTNVTEQEIKTAMYDFKLNKMTCDKPQPPYNYKTYKDWFKKYLTDNRAKYKHEITFKVVSISDKATREDLHSAFKFYWQNEYTIEFIRDRILSGEYPPKTETVLFDNLIKNKLIEVAND